MQQKIAVIGTGPAGITCALQLKDKGYTDTTLFGLFEEAQCVTVDVDGVKVDVAACYVHMGYRNTIYRLLKRFGFQVNYLDLPTLVTSDMKEIKPGMSPLVMYSYILYFLLFYFGWLLLHRTAFSKRYAVSMEKYMVSVGLSKLAHSFFIGPGGVAQGYGFLDEVTAYGAFRWFRPRLFLTGIGNRFKKGTATIREGHGGLFERILSGLNHVPKKIRTVKPVNDPVTGLPKVELTTESGEKLLFDKAIVTCSLDRIESPASPLIGNGDIRSSALFSYLFTSSTPSTFPDRIYFQDLIRNKVKNQVLTMRYQGKSDKGAYVYWAVGYGTEDLTPERLDEIMHQQLEGECGVNISGVRFNKIFRYNLRLSEEAVRRGLHLRLAELQGKDNIWYSGGMYSHWDLSSIYEHNRWLVSNLIYRDARTISAFLKLKAEMVLGRIRMV